VLTGRTPGVRRAVCPSRTKSEARAVGRWGGGAVGRSGPWHLFVAGTTTPSSSRRANRCVWPLTAIATMMLAKEPAERARSGTPAESARPSRGGTLSLAAILPQKPGPAQRGHLGVVRGFRPMAPRTLKASEITNGANMLNMWENCGRTRTMNSAHTSDLAPSFHATGRHLQLFGMFRAIYLDSDGRGWHNSYDTLIHN